MQSTDMIAGVVLDHEMLTLDELARACGVAPDWVVAYVEAGLFSDGSVAVTARRFSSADLRRARRMVHVERSFDAVPELAALVADLLEEVDGLRLRLRVAGPQA